MDSWIYQHVPLLREILLPSSQSPHENESMGARERERERDREREGAARLAVLKMELCLFKARTNLQ